MKRIFYIYTEATVACLMAFASLVELVCSFVVPEISALTFTASVAFALIAVHQVLSIVRSEKS